MAFDAVFVPVCLHACLCCCLYPNVASRLPLTLVFVQVRVVNGVEDGQGKLEIRDNDLLCLSWFRPMTSGVCPWSRRTCVRRQVSPVTKIALLFPPSVCACEVTEVKLMGRCQGVKASVVTSRKTRPPPFKSWPLQPHFCAVAGET